MKLFRGKCGEINALATRRIAGEQQSISQNAPHKRNQRLALEPIWFWLAGSLPNVPDELPRAAAMADLQSSGSLPPLRRSKSRRTAWSVGAIRSVLRCSKPIAKPVIIPSSKSICRILAPTSAPRPSSAPSSSASRFTAGAGGFLHFSQSEDRPERKLPPASRRTEPNHS